jgi:hypothetical protein
MYKIASTQIFLKKFFVGENYYFDNNDILKNKKVVLIEIVNFDTAQNFTDLNGATPLPVVDYFIDCASLFLTLINYNDQQIISNYPVNLLVNDVVNIRGNRLKKLFPQFNLYDINLNKSYLTVGKNDPAVNRIIPFNFFYTD